MQHDRTATQQHDHRRVARQYAHIALGGRDHGHVDGL